MRSRPSSAPHYRASHRSCKVSRSWTGTMGSRPADARRRYCQHRGCSTTCNMTSRTFLSRAVTQSASCPARLEHTSSGSCLIVSRMDFGSGCTSISSKFVPSQASRYRYTIIDTRLQAGCCLAAFFRPITGYTLETMDRRSCRLKNNFQRAITTHCLQATFTRFQGFSQVPLL